MTPEGVSTNPPQRPLAPYTKSMNNGTQMTLETANLIWNACYGDNVTDGWDLYTSEQRLQAIETRNAHANGGGQWGIWNISDRD